MTCGFLLARPLPRSSHGDYTTRTMHLMRRLVLLTLGMLAYAQERPVVLKTSTLLDGRGKTLKNTLGVVEGSKILRVGGAAPANAITYDLTAFTVSPGWIDTHA